MTVGFHSPLPPAPTGVAGYSARLIQALREFGEIRVGAQTADVHLYHLGNNPLHGEIYERALGSPGVAVLHDAVLHHFLLGRLNREAYIEEFVYNYGEWFRQLAAELWRGRSASAIRNEYFRYPMLRRIAERSRLLVVHNQAAAKMVLEHAPGSRVEVIPHLWAEEPQVSAARQLRLKQRLGLSARAFVFGVYGYLRETKGLTTILRAFHRARRQVPELALLIAGEFASEDLKRSIAPALRSPGIIRMGYSPPTEFSNLIATADACINLRRPPAGETSGIALRAMGLGKPVLLTESLETADFPVGCCFKIAPGLAEEDELVHYMVLLASSPGLCEAVGRKAATLVRQRHNARAAAQTYWRALCDFRGASC